jgi:hypothetical protein
LFILADDLGYGKFYFSPLLPSTTLTHLFILLGDVGVYWNNAHGRIATPNIDKMAAEGIFLFLPLPLTL